MSKFCAKVKLERDKNAEHLVKAFFQNFNVESSIAIKGNEAKMKIVFEKTPMEIVDAISHCKIVEFNCGKEFKGYEEDESVQVESKMNTEQESKENEISEQVGQTFEENEDSKRTGQAKKKQVTKLETKPVNIPELKEIAKKATSFDDFAELIAKGLEKDQKKQSFLKNLIIVSADVDIITWKKLEAGLEKKKIYCKESDKNWARKQVSLKFNITMLPFLKAVVEYKDYSFKQIEEYDESTEQLAEEATGNIEEISEEAKEKPRLKMECMPEIKNFEETLASVDKTQPVEKRIQYVLETMGLSQLSDEEQKQIIEIASISIRKSKMDLPVILKETKIPVEQKEIAHLTFSKFVNDFVQKYESDRKVKLLTFLSELQKIIMLEGEIEEFSNVTE